MFCNFLENKILFCGNFWYKKIGVNQAIEFGDEENEVSTGSGSGAGELDGLEEIDVIASGAARARRPEPLRGPKHVMGSDHHLKGEAVLLTGFSHHIPAMKKKEYINKDKNEELIPRRKNRRVKLGAIPEKKGGAKPLDNKSLGHRRGTLSVFPLFSPLPSTIIKSGVKRY